jgi:hypothetical protein
MKDSEKKKLMKDFFINEDMDKKNLEMISIESLYHIIENELEMSKYYLKYYEEKIKRLEIVINKLK